MITTNDQSPAAFAICTARFQRKLVERITSDEMNSVFINYNRLYQNNSSENAWDFKNRLIDCYCYMVGCVGMTYYNWPQSEGMYGKNIVEEQRTLFNYKKEVEESDILCIVRHDSDLLGIPTPTIFSLFSHQIDYSFFLDNFPSKHVKNHLRLAFSLNVYNPEEKCYNCFFWVYQPEDPIKGFAANSFGYDNAKYCRMRRKPMLSYECCEDFTPWGLNDPEDLKLY